MASSEDVPQEEGTETMAETTETGEALVDTEGAVRSAGVSAAAHRRSYNRMARLRRRVRQQAAMVEGHGAAPRVGAVAIIAARVIIAFGGILLAYGACCAVDGEFGAVVLGLGLGVAALGFQLRVVAEILLFLTRIDARRLREAREERERVTNGPTPVPS